MRNNVTLDYLLKIIPGLLLMAGNGVKAGLNTIFHVYLYDIGNKEYAFTLDGNVKNAIHFETMYHGIYHDFKDLDMNNPIFEYMVKMLCEDIYSFMQKDNFKEYIWEFIQNEIEYNNLDGIDDLYDLETFIYDFLYDDNPDLTCETIDEVICEHKDIISKYVNIA